MPRLFIALLLFVVALPVKSFGEPIAQQQLQTIIKALAPVGPIRSQFTQTKTMQLLSRPLVSSGQMIFDPELGLYWQLQTPFATTLLVNQQRIVQISGDQRSILTRAEQPAAFAFSQIFFQLLSGDIEGLEQQFMINYKPAAGVGWQMALVPKEAQLRAVIAQVELLGGDDLEKIMIKDHAGDQTMIEFFQRDNSTQKLSEQEQQYFAR